jgi:hypothetical protein
MRGRGWYRRMRSRIAARRIQDDGEGGSNRRAFFVVEQGTQPGVLSFFSRKSRP